MAPELGVLGWCALICRVLHLGNRADPRPGDVIDLDGTGVRKITLEESLTAGGPTAWLLRKVTDEEYRRG